jgi:hypothetical protein
MLVVPTTTSSIGRPDAARQQCQGSGHVTKDLAVTQRRIVCTSPLLGRHFGACVPGEACCRRDSFQTAGSNATSNLNGINILPMRHYLGRSHLSPEPIQHLEPIHASQPRQVCVSRSYIHVAPVDRHTFMHHCCLQSKSARCSRPICHAHGDHLVSLLVKTSAGQNEHPGQFWVKIIQATWSILGKRQQY